MNRLASDVHVTALIKNHERYIVLFDKTSAADAMRTLGRWASNPDLTFTWYDAAVMSKSVKKAASECLGK